MAARNVRTAERRLAVRVSCERPSPFPPRAQWKTQVPQLRSALRSPHQGPLDQRRDRRLGVYLSGERPFYFPSTTEEVDPLPIAEPVDTLDDDAIVEREAQGRSSCQMPNAQAVPTRARLSHARCSAPTHCAYQTICLAHSCPTFGAPPSGNCSLGLASRGAPSSWDSRSLQVLLLQFRLWGADARPCPEGTGSRQVLDCSNRARLESGIQPTGTRRN